LSRDGERAGRPEGGPVETTPEGPVEAPDSGATDAEGPIEEARDLSTDHLRGLLEALVFASDKPMPASELAKLASAPLRQVKALIGELKEHYAHRGIVLQEVAGGWVFRTGGAYAPFVRELTSERPVKLSRAQLETLAITAYRQPITRPEIDEIRGVDSGATLKLLLERGLLRILGKKDEPGRPLLYGTTSHFLEFFGLKSLKDLPTLREFTELSEDSQRSLEDLPPADVGEADHRTIAPADVGEADHRTIAPVDVGEADHRTIAPVDDRHRTIAPAQDPDVHDTIIPSAPPTGDDLEDPPDSAPTIDER